MITHISIFFAIPTMLHSLYRLLNLEPSVSEAAAVTLARALMLLKEDEV